MYRSNLYPTLMMPLYRLERGQYVTYFDDFGVVEEPVLAHFGKREKIDRRRLLCLKAL